MARDHGERSGIFKFPLGPSRRQAEDQQFPHDEADPRGNAIIAKNVERTHRAWFQICRSDDRLRIHAGRWHGQRPSRYLLSPRSPCEIQAQAMTSKPARRAKSAPRAWQRMLSGRRLNLLDPSPLDVELDDIAHGLARVARWNGQTVGGHIFSVAQHSLLVEAIASHIDPDMSREWRLAVLLHDAPEYVIGDIISPFKAVIGDAYKTIESGLLAAIHLHFGLPAQPAAALKRFIKQA